MRYKNIITIQGELTCIFLVIFLFFYVSLFGNEKQIKISSLDSTSIKLLLDSLIADNSSYTLEYHLKSFDIDKKTSHYQAFYGGNRLIP